MVQVLRRLRELPTSVRVLKRPSVRRKDAQGPEREHDQLFRYTSGRWIYNEREQMRIRYVSFDVDALQQVAIRAAAAERCTRMVKIAEGSFNKIFSLDLDNGKKLIAKIPCPLVAPRHLCTASEVATMDYARNVLGLPVPHILRWSANAATSEIGTEYILMEHVEGVELQKRMNKFRREAADFVDQLVDVECKFAQCRFSQIGSLYYKEDVSPELQQRPLYADGREGDGSDRFRIGPCVDYDIWRGKRSDLDADHGPWPDTLSYVRAIVDIEKKWLSSSAVPRQARDPFRRPGSENVPDVHVRLLEDFLAVIPSVLPPDELCAPVLWHTDLHASNIFVPPEGPPDILGLIDWQGVSVKPLFLQATFAACVLYDGDERITIPPGMDTPTLPADFESYSEEDKEYLKGQERLAVIHKYYQTCVMHRNPSYFASQTYPHIEHIIPPILSASRTWYEGMHKLRQVLLELQEAWDGLALETPFPVSWDADEVAKHREAYPRLVEYEERVEKVVEGLQLEGDGWVTNERYDEVMRRSKSITKDWKPKEFGGPYPFQDGGRSWFLS